jgi:hypothetical protein
MKAEQLSVFGKSRSGSLADTSDFGVLCMIVCDNAKAQGI